MGPSGLATGVGLLPLSRAAIAHPQLLFSASGFGTHDACRGYALATSAQNY